MKKAIQGYHQDDENHWVAELECGHFQHVRHRPPWINRMWVTSESGRDSMVGKLLQCKKCDSNEAKDV